MNREQAELDEVRDERESLEQQLNEQAQVREIEIKGIRIMLEQHEESQNNILESLEQRAMKRSPTSRR